MKRLLQLLLLLAACSTRLFAADIVWTNVLGGEWNTPANWSPNQVPGVPDHVWITNNGTYAVLLNAHATNAGMTVGGDFGTQTLTSASSFLVLNGASTIGEQGVFITTGGTLMGAGELVVDGVYQWSGGIISSATGVRVNNAMVISGNNSKSIRAGRIINYGTVSWNGGSSIGFGNTAIFSNALEGTINIAFDATILNESIGGRIDNRGSIRQTAGVVGTQISGPVAINNFGTLDILAGGFELEGGTSSGLFNVAASTSLRVGNSTHNFTADSTITGAGNFEMNGVGGIANIGGGFFLNASNTFTAGTANFTNNYNIVGGAITVQGGTANFNAAGTIHPATLSVSSGALGGTNEVVVSGPMSWTGGTIGARVWANGGLSLGGGIKTLEGNTGGRVINTANATWPAGGEMRFRNQGVLSNAPDATFDISFDAEFINDSSRGIVANGGLWRQVGGAVGSTFTTVAFNNSGSVEIQAAGMRFNGGGTNHGTMTVEAGTLVTFSSGYEMRSDSSLSGAGDLLFNNPGPTPVNFHGDVNITGAATVDGDFSAANFLGAGIAIIQDLELFEGEIGGDRDLRVTGSMAWTGGRIRGSVISETSLAISGPDFKELRSQSSPGRLINTGQATWSGGGPLWFFQGLLSNAPSGVFDVAFDATFENGSGGGGICNAGIFRQTGGVGGSTVHFPINFTNYGNFVLDTAPMTFLGRIVQTNGSTVLKDSGLITNVMPLAVQGGNLSGSNTIFGTVSNASLVSPGLPLGKLTIATNYIQPTNGVLLIELGGTLQGTNYDLLVVGGTAGLSNTTLRVRLRDGFMPGDSDTFTFLTCSNRVGQFGPIDYPTNLFSGVEVTYTPTTATLRLVPLDLVTLPPTLHQPAENSATKNPVSVSFTLPEAASPPVTLTFNDGTTDRVLSLTGFTTAGTHTFNFDPASPTMSSEIASGPAIPDGAYTVTLTYSDAEMNPAANDVHSNVKIDTITQTPILTKPVLSYTNADVEVAFQLPEPALPGSLKLRFHGPSEHVLLLTNSQETAGPHGFTFVATNPTASLEILSGESIPNGTYSVTLSYQDILGNAVASATLLNVSVVTCVPYELLNLPTVFSSEVGKAFLLTLNAAAGTPPYTFRVSAGTLAPGMTLASDGTYSGTPTTRGEFTFTVQVKDYWGCIESRTTTHKVECQPIVLSPADKDLPTGVVGQNFVAGTGANREVKAIALSENGILLGGAFTEVNGTPHLGLARLFPSGREQSDFPSPAFEGRTVQALLAQPNGRIVVGSAGTDATRLDRLLPSGAQDGTFNVTLEGGHVFCLARQPDGKILAGGEFTRANGLAFSNLIRLNENGSLDTSFVTDFDKLSQVTTMLVQPNGKIVAAGYFFSVDGITRNYIARLNADGRLDPTFDAGTGQDFPTVALTAHGDGFLIGGSFRNFGGASRLSLARLNSNGTLDTAFVPQIDNTSTPYVYSIAVQPDNKVLIGGNFLSIGGISRARIARLNADGTLDATFNPGSGAGGIVRSIVIQPDGYILIGGTFTTVNGQSRNRYARLKPDGSLDDEYRQQITATGGIAPLTFNITTGSLPEGLVISPSGLISGTPTEAGNYSFTITATDNVGCTDARNYTLPIECPNIALLSGTLPNAPVGIAYSHTLAAFGGTSPRFFLASGSLPTGMTLSESGVLSGTPGQSGTFTFSVRVEDGFDSDCSGTGSFSIKVAARLRPPVRRPDGRFEFLMDAERDRGHVIEYSTDMSTWLPLTNFIPTESTVTIVDPDTATSGRFYRAVAQ